MKTKELIRRLQEQDPSGEHEVCVDNMDIVSVYAEPAYWDGRLQVLERDEDGKIIGARYETEGFKITIEARSISEILFDCPEFPVCYDKLRPDQIEDYKKYDQDIIDHGERITYETNLSFFTDWAREQCDKIGFDDPTINGMSPQFALHHKDKIFPEFNMCEKSILDQLHEHWEKCVKVTVNNGFLRLEYDE